MGGSEFSHHHHLDLYRSGGQRAVERAERQSRSGYAQTSSLRNRSARKARRAAQKRARY